VQKLGPATINNVLTTLRHVLQVARKRGLIDRLPEIVRMKAPPSRFDFHETSEHRTYAPRRPSRDGRSRRRGE